VPPVPNVRVEPFVPLNETELLIPNVTPSTNVIVAPVATAVNATLLIDVAVATPSDGVVSDGEVDNTTEPDPVDVVTPVPPLSTANVPVTPVDNGNPVQLVNTPDDGVPMLGVVSDGLDENTSEPVPVSSDMTVANSAEVVAANTDNLFAIYATVPPKPNDTDAAPPESLVVMVIEFDTNNVFPSAIVKVEPVAGDVTVTLLTVPVVNAPYIVAAVVLLVPITVVFAPRPTAFAPIAIEFESAKFAPIVLYPINVLLPPVVVEFDPFA